MPVTHNDGSACGARLAAMIEEFRVAKQRQLVRRGLTLWNGAEAQQARAPLGQPWPIGAQGESALSKLAAAFSATAQTGCGPKE